MKKAGMAVFVLALLMAIVCGIYLNFHRGRSLLGISYPVPSVSLETKARLFEIRLSYRQNFDIIAELEADQQKLDGQIADKLKGVAANAPVPNDVLDLRIKWKQDADAIKSLKDQQPQIEAQFTSTVATAVKAAHLPDTYTISVPNNLEGIKFVVNPQQKKK